MNNLAKEDTKDVSSDFFTANIGSLLDVSSDVSRIEIIRNLSGNYLHEQIVFVFKPKNY